MIGGGGKEVNIDFNEFTKSLINKRKESLKLMAVNEGYSNSLGIMGAFSNVSEYTKSFNTDTIRINKILFEPGKLNYIKGGNILNSKLRPTHTIYNPSINSGSFNTGFRCVSKIINNK